MGYLNKFSWIDYCYSQRSHEPFSWTLTAYLELAVRIRKTNQSDAQRNYNYE